MSSSSINGHDLTPLLTREDVAQWRRELLETEGFILAAQAKVVDLKRRLEAAAVFMPGAADEEWAVVMPASDVGKSRTLYEAIRRVVERSDAPMAPKTIRRAIASGVDADLLSSDNYLYTAIKRVADKGEIIKEGAGYVRGLFS